MNETTRAMKQIKQLADVSAASSKPTTKLGAHLPGQHDSTIATLIIDEYGKDIVYDSSNSQWRVFTRGRWQDPNVSHSTLIDWYDAVIVNISKGKYYHNGIVGSPNWLQSAMSQSKKSAILKLVQVKCAMDAKYFDDKPNLVGIQDLVYDMSTHKVRPALGTDLVTKSVGTTYDPRATCPEWKRFLATAMQNDSEMIDYLQRLVGYFLTASTEEQEIYYFYGSGANGKSTFLDLVKALLGNYSQKISSQTFIRSYTGEQSNFVLSNIAKLSGARLALTDEAGSGNVKFDSQSLKSISGDDEMTGRLLYANTTTFNSTAKVVMYGNDKPYGDINDEGLWRRFRFIHFDYVVPEKQRDPKLLDKLKAEMPGILNWALDGLAQWQKVGTNTPQRVKDDGANYRKDLDTVTDFIDRNVKTDPKGRVLLKDLYDAYEAWCVRNLMEPEAKSTFSRKVKLHYEHSGTVSYFRTSSTRGYKGIQLTH